MWSKMIEFRIRSKFAHVFTPIANLFFHPVYSHTNRFMRYVMRVTNLFLNLEGTIIKV